MPLMVTQDPLVLWGRQVLPEVQAIQVWPVFWVSLVRQVTQERLESKGYKVFRVTRVASAPRVPLTAPQEPQGLPAFLASQVGRGSRA